MLQDLSLDTIFTAGLTQACDAYKYSMHDEVKQYVTNTFVHNIASEFASKPNESFDLFIIHDQLPHTSAASELLRHNGDYYLTLAGFMPEALCDRFSEFEYYLYVGKYSYYRLSQRLPSAQLYKTLSFDYMKLVYILNETFDIIRTRDNIDIIKTFDAYKKTKHAIFRKRLARVGLSISDINC